LIDVCGNQTVVDEAINQQAITPIDRNDRHNGCRISLKNYRFQRRNCVKSILSVYDQTSNQVTRYTGRAKK